MNPFDSPFAVSAAFLVAQLIAAFAGDLFRKVMRPLREEEREDFASIRTATMTILGLIIGFSFLMVVTRFDQRKQHEQVEANAIGAEYSRASLLPAEDAARVRELLTQYVDQRILFYLANNERQISQINADTEKLQAELWSAVIRVTATQPTPVVALAVSGMNDVLNAQSYSQAAWRNRIPRAAWGLMLVIVVSCNLLFGYGQRRTSSLALILPFIVSILVLLIADMDSPRGGVIRVGPENLISLAQSMRASSR